MNTSVCELALMACGGVALLLPSSLVKAVPLHAQEPTVVTRFEVDAARIDAEVGDPGVVAALEDTLSHLLAAKGGEHFPYLAWQGASSTAQGPPALSVVAVQTEQDTGGPTPCHRIDLAFRAVLADGTRELGDHVTVYRMCGSVPGHFDDLYRDFRDTVAGRFDNEEFRRTVQSVLLSKIALADRIMLDEFKRGVVTPVKWRTLSADPDWSEMALAFVVRLPDRELDGIAQLEKPTEITRAELQDRNDPAIQNWLGLVRWSPRHLELTDSLKLQTNIVPTLKSLSTSNALADMRAFMARYRPLTLTGLDDCLDGTTCGDGHD